MVDTFDVRVCVAAPVRYSVNFLSAHEKDLHRIDVPLQFTMLQTCTSFALFSLADMTLARSIFGFALLRHLFTALLLQVLDIDTYIFKIIVKHLTINLLFLLNCALLGTLHGLAFWFEVCFGGTTQSIWYNSF